MFPPYRSSIKQKVMLVIMLASITVLLVAATAFMIYDPVTVRQTLSHYLASLAQQIAEIPVIQKARSSLSINRSLPQACSFQRSIAQSTQHRQENFVTCGTQFGRTRFSAIAFFLLGCHQCKLQRILTVDVRFAKRRASVRPKRLGRFGGIIGVCAKMPVLATLARQLQFSTRIARVSNRTGRFHTSLSNPMNAASPLQGERTMLSLFQIAAYFEDFFPAGGIQRSASSMRPSPLADFLLHPEKLKAWLASSVKGNAPATAPRKKGQRPSKRSPQSGTSKELGEHATSRPSDLLRGDHNVEFSLHAPAARSVKLAADFTKWDQSPVDLTNVNGVWRATIPLAPGLYSYRFIVNGLWCDDPHSTQRVPNPFGTENSIIWVS